MPVPFGEHDGATQQRSGLEETAGGSEGPALAGQQLRDHVAEVHALRDLQGLVEDDAGLAGLGRKQVAACQLPEKADAIRILGHEPAERRPDLGQERQSIERTALDEERVGHVGCSARLESAIAVPSSDGEQLVPLRQGGGRVHGPRELGHAQVAQAELLAVASCELGRLAEVPCGARVGPDVTRARCRTLERGRRLRPQGVPIVVGGEPDGFQVVGRHHAGQLVATLRAEDLRGGKMTSLPLLARQPAVCHLSQDALEESVLAALRRPRIVVVGEELAAHEVVEDALDGRLRPAGEGGDGRDREADSQHGAGARRDPACPGPVHRGERRAGR